MHMKRVSYNDQIYVKLIFYDIEQNGGGGENWDTNNLKVKKKDHPNIYIHIYKN